MQKSENIKKLIFGISGLFVFLVFMNFRDFPNSYAVLGAFGISLFYMLLRKNRKIGAAPIILGCALFCFAKIAGYSMKDVVIMAAYPAVFSVLGTMLMKEGKTLDFGKNSLLIAFFTFLAGFTIHGMLNSYVYFAYGLPIENLHYWNDVWTGLRIPATQHSIYLLPVLAVVVPAVIYFKNHKIVSVFLFAVSLVFLYQSFDVLSRIPVVVLGAVGAWQILLFLWWNRDNKKLMKFLVWTVGILAVAGVAVLIISWDWLQSIPFIQNLSADGGILNNIRFKAQRSVLQQMFLYPMGGVEEMYTEGLLYVHNVWLDMAKRTGLIPFTLFTIYTLFSFVQMTRLLCSDASREVKSVLSGVYLAFVLYYTVEPALDANIQFIVPWAYINGLVHGYNQGVKDNMDNILTKRQRMYLPVKRTIDVILSGIAIVVLSPLLLGISLAIKLDSPGPVLFKQKRVGKDKVFFDIWKFRTMRTDTPKDMPTHLLRDPEQYITKTGKFLRKTSLDELPQLFQIFTGEMSICGPRPALWNQDDLIAERDKYGANGVTPGLTGWAQINGRDELEIDVKAKLDGEYIEKFGFAMDVKCFFGTIVSVLKSDGVVEGGTGELNRKK